MSAIEVKTPVLKRDQVQLNREDYENVFKTAQKGLGAHREMETLKKENTSLTSENKCMRELGSHLGTLQQSLKEKTYCPRPVKRVYIPKDQKGADRPPHQIKSGECNGRVLCVSWVSVLSTIQKDRPEEERAFQTEGTGHH